MADRDHDFEDALEDLKLLENLGGNSVFDLGVLQEIVRAVNVHNGWYDSDRTFGDDIALLHSEVSEAFEAYRDTGSVEDQTNDSQQFCWETGEHNPTICKWGLRPGECRYIPPKPEGVGSELADVLVRLLDTCQRYNINLEYEFIRKMKYNASREYRHGNKKV